MWFATLLKSHFSMGVLLKICCIFFRTPFPKTPLRGCFWPSQANNEVHKVKAKIRRKAITTNDTCQCILGTELQNISATAAVNVPALKDIKSNIRRHDLIITFHQSLYVSKTFQLSHSRTSSRTETLNFFFLTVVLEMKIE